MPWLQIHIRAARSEADPLGDALSAAGAVSVTLKDAADQPIFEPGVGETPLWQDTEVVGLFEAGADPQWIRTLVEAELGHPLSHWRTEQLEDQAWERAWLKDFRPMAFGERLWVVPTSFDPPQPEAVNLRLDPGLAFGTGTHATTALCLRWLDTADVRGKAVIDFGCGSGILAIAALLLGAREAVCIDIDPQALEATRTNAELNGCAERIHTYLPDAAPSEPAPVVLANILAAPLIELAPQITQRVSPGGELIMSGLLAEQADAVAAAYREHFHVAPPVTDQEWARLDAVRLSR